MVRSLLVLALLTVHAQAAAWLYKDEADEMGRGTRRYAIVESLNTVTFDFPYSGPQRAMLILRADPRRGRHAILKLDRAQFLCRLDGCSVLVRFDEKNAERFSATGTEDRSTNAIFINGYARFLQGMRSAKRLKIEAQFFQEGNHVFKFDVAGLKWDAPAAAKAKPTESPRDPKAEQARMQEKMRACSQEASAQSLRGDERKQFMSTCLKG